MDSQLEAQGGPVPQDALLGTVLLVDDDVDVLNSLAAFLRRRGLEVFTAADGDEGLEAAVRHQPAVIVLDLQMPRMHGLDVIDQLRARGMRQEIIAITGLNPAEFERPALHRGADHWLAKPFEPDTLVSYVNVGLRRAREHAPASTIMVGDLWCDTLTGAARRGARIFALSTIERRLVACLAANPGRSLSILELRRAAWDDLSEYADMALTHRAEHSVEVAVWRLMGKINGPGERRLLMSLSVNARRVGYQLASDHPN
jgi:two-component system, OmpR family, response regulator